MSIKSPKRWTPPPRPTRPPADDRPRYRLSADCPACGNPLCLRTNRRTQEPFLGCSTYPGCDWAEPFEEAMIRVQVQMQLLYEQDPGALLYITQGALEETRGVLQYTQDMLHEMEMRLLIVEEQRDQTVRRAEQLLAENTALQMRLIGLLQSRAGQQTSAPLTPDAALAKRLTQLISAVHPDKWQGQSGEMCATELTRQLLALRKQLTNP